MGPETHNHTPKTKRDRSTIGRSAANMERKMITLIKMENYEK
jgi:hypothetical protein